MLDFFSIAQGAVAIISPFLPVLLKLANAAGEKLEGLAEGQVKEQAEKLWNKIVRRFQGDPVLTSAATMVADAPADDTRQKMLADTLGKRLQGDPEFAQQLLNEIGGPKRLQEVIAGNDAVINGIYQRMKGPGTQRTQGGDRAYIANVTQDMGE
jgi:hypothetical protein